MQDPVSDLSFLPAEIYSVYMNVGYRTNFHSFIGGDLQSFFLFLSLSHVHTHKFTHTHTLESEGTLWITSPSSIVKVKMYLRRGDLSSELFIPSALKSLFMLITP